MKIKSVSCTYVHKKMGDLQLGDKIVGPAGEKYSIREITDHGEQDVYKITLSDGRSFESMLSHLSTVHFRNSHVRPDKKVYDTVTTGYIMDHLDKYLFEIPTDETFNWSDLDAPQFLEMLPLHEYEPIDDEYLIPDLTKDPNKVYITSIEKTRREICKCIAVDYPWGLYLIEDGILTHNSLLTNLCMSYEMVLFGLMREPYRLLGHSPMTSYCVCLCSFSLGKAWDLLGTPFEQFIEQSPVFEKVGRRDDVVNADKLDPDCSKILFSTAGRGSARMLFRNNLQLKMMSTEGHLLGNTIIYAAMSELSWWEQNGWTKEAIKSFFDKACQRVDSRMNGHYLGRYVIDSSPFSLEAPIDKWIWSEAITDPKWYCVLGAKWDYFKKEFPEFFDKNGKEIHNWDVAFQCYKGGKSEPPKACKTEGEAQLYDPLDLVWCPKKDIKSTGQINLMSLALQNPVEFLRDWAGIPAGSSDRIFQAGNIIENVFDNDLRNIYTSIVADEAFEPEHLIWDQIKDKFFINFNGKYMFYREPGAKRVLAVDQSESGDATAVTMAHWEYISDTDDETTSKDLVARDVKNVLVADFTIVIIPKGGKINLDAIKYFIQDLTELGNINLGLVNFDNYQSHATKQYLARREIPLTYVSADKSNEPYTELIDYIKHERVFVGKNIFLKNNLRSIHWYKRESGSTKVEHFFGKICNESEDTNWETSQLGVNAKDAADTLAECIHMLIAHDVDFAPSTKWINSKYEQKETINKKLDRLGFQF